MSASAYSKLVVRGKSHSTSILEVSRCRKLFITSISSKPNHNILSTMASLSKASGSQQKHQHPIAKGAVKVCDECDVTPSDDKPQHLLGGPGVICDGCDGFIPPERSFFHCNCSQTDFDICLMCTLAKPELTSLHRLLEPCVVDTRDKRRTFILGPDVDNLRDTINRLEPQAPSVWKLSHQHKRFYGSMHIERVSKDDLASKESYEPVDMRSASVTTKRIKNDYSVYTPLDRSRKEIRLAQLLPGSPRDPIKVVTRAVPYPWTSLFPAWLALSYTWGSLDETRKILFTQAPPKNNIGGGGDGDQVDTPPAILFSCTTNLEMALRELRKERNALFLWIDALCINQSDMEEREYQVTMMAEIYSHARQVVVWLGAGPGVISAASHVFQISTTLPDIRKKLAGGEDSEIGQHVGYHALEYMARYLDEKASSASSCTMNKLRQFFEIPWFSRAWVAQEVWAARSIVVMCGDKDHTLSWEAVMQANAYLDASAMRARSTAATPNKTGRGSSYHAQPSGYTTWKRIVQDPNDATRKSLPIPAIELFDQVTLWLKAGDTRDLIFAILGMSVEASDMPVYPSLIAPNYSKPPWQVFSDFTRWHIMHHKSLNILGPATHTTRGESPGHYHLGGSIPSWSVSPVFTIPWYNLGTLSDRTPHQADANTRLDIRLIDSVLGDRCLITQGYEMDRITWVDRYFFAPKFGAYMRNSRDIAPFPWRMYTDSDLVHRVDLKECGLESLWRLVRKKLGVGSCNSNDDDDKKLPCKCHQAFDTMVDVLTCGGQVREAPLKIEGHSLADITYQYPARSELYSWFASHWVSTVATDPGMKKHFCQRLRTVLLPLAAESSKDELSKGILGSAFKNSLYMTNSGAMGTCHPNAREGDLVVVLIGCRAPAVLTQRQVDTTEVDSTHQQQSASSPLPTWRFVGECYLKGLMDGEAVKEKLRSNVPVQTFTLR